MGYQKSGKTGTSWFLEKAISRIKQRYWGNFSGMLRKQIEIFSIDVIGTLLRGASFTSPAVLDSKVFFFDTLSCLASVGWRVSKCLKLGHAQRLGHYTRKIALNDEHLSQFSPDRKVLWMNLKNVLRSSLILPGLIAAEQCAYCSGGKSTFDPMWVRKGPKNLNFFIGILSAVASNRSKAQSKDLRKLHWKHAEGFFLKLLFPVEFFFHNMPFDG